MQISAQSMKQCWNFTETRNTSQCIDANRTKLGTAIEKYSVLHDEEVREGNVAD